MSAGNYEEGWEKGFQEGLKLANEGWDGAIQLLDRSKELLREHRHWLGYPECRADGDKLFADLEEFLGNGDEETPEGDPADTD